ncbi:MAG: CAP domain-containing protein [bacterium]|nr:CAP domain-containing protein [bacterium]
MGVTASSIHRASLLVIPRHGNNYHPLALRHGPLAFVSTLIITAKILALGVVALTPTTAELSTITVDRIVQLTNAQRAQVGLNELATSPKLAAAAKMKGEDMLANDYFAHISPTGVTPWFWMHKTSYSYQVAGENLAIDFTEAENVVAAWLASPTHKENMLLPDYVETGVAVVTGEFQGGTSTIVVHMFGRPSVETAIPPLNSPPPTVPAVKSEITATPSPTPVPTVIPSPEAVPPRTPRIALANNINTVSGSAELLIESEPQTTIHLLANGREQAALLVDESGRLDYSLDLTDLPDGDVVITGYAENETTKSGSAQTLVLHKDATGPQLAKQELWFVLSPITDEPQAVFKINSSENATVIVAQGQEQREVTMGQYETILVDTKPFILSLRDKAGNDSVPVEVTLEPGFARENDTQYVLPPARFTHAVRWLAMIVLVVISLLLGLAIFVKIRIQRPALITHASLVLLLAVLVLLI